MRSSENVSWFPDITLKDRPAVGGKGGSLGELTRAGIEVPPGFVVRTSAFDRLLGALEKRELIRSRVEVIEERDLEQIKSLSGQLRARFENAQLPSDLQEEILAAHAELCRDAADSPLAIR